jgi:aspartate aminotransferase
MIGKKRMAKLSSKFSNITESKTVALKTVLQTMKREGKDIVALGAGEPDFDTPEHIKEAAIKALRAGFTKYTPADGIIELKEAIAAYIKSDFGVEYEPAEIVVTCGAKHAVFQGILAICEEGDEVLLPIPYWVSYPEQVKLSGAMLKILNTSESNQFKIRPEQLLNEINSKTKLLILNSPSNPSGAVYTREELSELADVISESGIYVLSDEIYDKIVYDNAEFVSLASFPKIRDQVLLVNGVSKTFSMTGWRIGFLAGDREIISAVVKFQGHSTSNTASISQRASITALTESKEFFTARLTEFDKRRKYVHKRLTAIPKVSCMIPQGAFYAFPRFAEYYGAQYDGKVISNSTDICEYLIKYHGVAIVPGGAFGMDEHVRLSFATSMENLDKALNRIETGLAQL